MKPHLTAVVRPHGLHWQCSDGVSKGWSTSPFAAYLEMKRNDAFVEIDDVTPGAAHTGKLAEKARRYLASEFDHRDDANARRHIEQRLCAVGTPYFTGNDHNGGYVYRVMYAGLEFDIFLGSPRSFTLVRE